MRDEEKTKEQLIQEIAELRQRVCSLETLTAQQQQAEKALYEHTQRQVQREQALNRVIQSIRNSLDIKTIFSTAAREVAQLVQADRAEIVQYLSERQLWLNVTDYRKNLELPSALGLEIPDVNNEVASRLKRLEVVLIEDASTYPDEINRDFAETYSGAWLLVPLQVGSSVWGSLSVIRTHQSSTWQQEDVELTCAVADQLAIAIQQSTLYEQVQNELLERKRTEEKIRQQAALLNIATDAILVRDLNHKILFWNKSAERLYGWKTQEALGQNAQNLLYREIPPQLQEALHQVNKTGEWYGELNKVRKDGKEIIVESRWTLVQDENGKPKSILTVDTDITEKKQLQTQFLPTQRLESLGTLASGIAHDLNNILSPILLSAQILQIKIGNDQHNKLLETLEINTQRGANLVKQVLSFARGVEGERTVLQIKHLIMEIQQLAKQTFPKSIEFFCKIAPNLWTVCGDATQLYQMLMNLVINSRDAMPKGGILELSAENFFIDENYARMNIEATVGPHIVISVRDTGIGMSPEVLDRIFEPFFTTKAVGQGTGLGLSTVLGIVKSHGGFINVSSSVGKGTEFQVFLKAVMENETQSIENLELPTGNGELILVVDDEAKIREITKTTLENYNYKVIIASDGIAAISLYAQNVSDIRVVLLDMMMPTMDGFTAIQTLKKINPFVKIIASSGLRENQPLAESVGIHKFLPKPYTVKQLLQMLQSLI